MTFRGLQAVKDFTATIEKGKICGLIGTNGAGKTTVINMISGVLVPTSGKITFEGRETTRLSPEKISKMGILRTYQNLRLFKKMTVLENVIIGAQIDREYNDLEAVLNLPRYRKEEQKLRDESMEMLRVMGIEAYADHYPTSLAYGLQKRLEIARILVASPKLLLLDEPAAGMNPQESANLVQILKGIQKDYDLTILIIEHDMKVVMNLCDYIYVMATGEIIEEGLPDEIRRSQKVIDAYLGRAKIDA